MEDRQDDRLATNDPAGSGSLRSSADPAQGLRRRHREPLPARVQALQALPEAYRRALEPGLAALSLRLDDRQRAAIDDHVRLLLAWNQAINLTAIVEPATIATLHILDSLTAVPVLVHRGIRRLLDLGSGGGFPGIPLAVAAGLDHVTLVESIGRKASFLSAAAEVVMSRVPELRVEVAAVRAEDLASDPDQRDRWPAVTARAVAPLGELAELAFPLLEPGGVLVAWKRGDLEGELASGRRAVAALGGGSQDVVSVDLPGLEGHRLVVATRGGTVPTRFPRDPRCRKRRPW
jgi:16S rRNA (guanine527-N7)-methyltransferase